VRYYGGTNLGTGGLVRAYRLAAARALEAAGFEIVYETVTLDVRCPYDRTGLVRRLLDPPHVRLAAERFDPEPVIQLVVRRSRLEPVTRALQEARIEFAILES
jgi:putative IMPACT (imprinted ancient) family translation regulator